MTVSKFPTWWDYLQVAPQPPWWWKFELNNPGWKLSICATLITISRYLEAKFDFGYFIIFSSFWSQDFIQQILSHFEQKWRCNSDFRNFRFFNVFNIFVQNCGTIMQKKLKLLQSKMKAWQQFFPNFDFILNPENQHHALIFAQNYLKFFV